MCPGVLSRGVRGARWTQINAIARADVPWRPVERRLPCQMNCRKGGCRACTAVRGRLGFFLQTITRADMPWSAVWRGSRCPMDTNRCHRAGGCALQARRMAIALSDELQERGMQCLHGCAWQVGDLPANHRASQYALDCCLEGFATLDGHKLMPSRERMCPAGP